MGHVSRVNDCEGLSRLKLDPRRPPKKPLKLTSEQRFPIDLLASGAEPRALQDSSAVGRATQRPTVGWRE